MFGSVLSSILTGLHFSTSGLGTLIGIAEKAPQVIDASEQIAGTAAAFVPIAKTLYGDLGEIVGDIKAGKWSEAPDDIEKLTGDIQSAWGKAKMEAEQIAGAVQTLGLEKAA